MAAKLIQLDWSETGITVYCIIRRRSDSYLLNDADGSFASSPTDPYLSLPEDSTIKGKYEASESRSAWTDGLYDVTIYKQSGGSPSPASDSIIGSGEMYVRNDIELSEYGGNIIESNGNVTEQQALSLILAAQLGEYDATTDIFKDPSGTSVRIDSSSNASGNRGTSTLTPSS